MKVDVYLKSANEPYLWSDYIYSILLSFVPTWCAPFLSPLLLFYTAGPSPIELLWIDWITVPSFRVLLVNVFGKALASPWVCIV